MEYSPSGGVRVVVMVATHLGLNRVELWGPEASGWLVSSEEEVRRG